LTTLFRGIADKSRELVTALDIIVWAVDPKDNSLESVADYLSDFASEYLSHSEVACRFDIPIAMPSIVLDGRLRHALLLAVKETLNNIERHAHATEVEFRMTFAEDRLEIVISDNGKGFDAKTKRGGNGLKNLSLRLSRTLRAGGAGPQQPSRASLLCQRCRDETAVARRLREADGGEG
jgi:signal transduction histidine kinase